MPNDSSPEGGRPNSQVYSHKRKSLKNEYGKQNAKKAKLSLHVALESESSTSSDKEESVHSIQEYDTDLGIDTSDTSTHTLITGTESDISVHIEYELDSRSENENQIAGASSVSYSSPEDIVVNIVTVTKSEGLADDSDNSNCSLDYVIKSDFRYCALCRNLNSNPLYPSCATCFKMKKCDQVNRPKPKGRKRMSQRNNHVTQIESRQNLTEMDSKITSIANFNRFSNPQCSEEKRNSGLNLIKNKKYSCDKPKGSEKEESSTLHESPSRQQINRDCDQCNICFERPKDGAFIHGKSQHIYSCYRCALKIFHSNKKLCPICNRKLNTVTKVFVCK